MVDAVINGKLPWAIPGGDIGWAAGAQYRRSELPTGPYIFLGQSTPSQMDDSIYALFAEASLPVTDRWNFKIEDQIVNVRPTSSPRRWPASAMARSS